MNHWWVNQGGRYRIERDGNHIFAPLSDARGVTPAHWAALRRVTKGDLSLHYSKGAIRAIGRARGEGVVANRPRLANELPSEEVAGIDERGTLVEVDYFDMVRPIELGAIPIELRSPGNGPFTNGPKRRGTVQQGYLFSVSRIFVEELRERFRSSWSEELGIN